MKLLMFDFRCPLGHKTEALVTSDTKHISCRCGATAERLIAAPRIRLEGFSGDFPTAADAWEKRRNEQMAKEKKHKRDHGTEWIGKSADDFPFVPDPVE